MLDYQISLRPVACAVMVAVALSLPGPMALADSGHDKSDVTSPAAADADHEPLGPLMAMPTMDAARGMTLFAEKGCVACHAINGVGGHDATSLDAHEMEGVMNPFEFAAKMWRMAPVMIDAQEEALGQQILFSGNELADIIAFVHDDAQQHEFNETMLSPRVQKMMHHEHGVGQTGEDAHAEEIGHMH